MTDSPPLVQRARELAILTTAIAEATRGRGSTTVIEGPPGIGKTRLLEALASEASLSGVQVSAALGGTREMDYPFWVASQLFDGFVRRDACVLAGAAAAAADVFGAHPDRDVSPADAAGVIRGLFWLAANVSERAPLCLIVDDLHWADAPSTRFLHYLARRGADLPIALVLACRPATTETPPEVHETLAAASRRLPLAPFTTDEVRDFVETFAGSPPDAAFVAACVESAAGNPFLTMELVRFTLSHGLAPTAETAALLPSSTPAGVGDRVKVRLAALGGDAQRLAYALSVVGEADLGLCAEVAGLEQGVAGAAADALAREFLVHDRRPLSFVHPLVATAVTGLLPSADRSALHLRAARAHEHRMSSAEHVAAHVLAADPAADPWAVSVLRAAAREAAGRGAPDVAAKYLRRALDEGAGIDTEGLTLELGSAAIAAGDFAGAETLLTGVLERSASPEARDAAAASLVMAFAISGGHDAGVALFSPERVAALSPPVAVYAETFIAMGELLRISTHTMGARRIAALQESTRAASIPPPVRCALLSMTVMAGSNAYADETRESLLDLPLREPVRASLAGAFLLIGDPVSVEEILVPTRQACLMEGDIGNLGPSAAMGAIAAVMMGRIAEAVLLGRMAVDATAECGVAYGTTYAAAAYATALVEAGRPDDAAVALEAVEGDPRDGRHLGAWVEVARAGWHLANGRYAEAWETLTWVGDALREGGVRHLDFAPWHGHAVEAAQSMGDHAGALRVATEAMEIARKQGIPNVLGVAHRLMGQARGDEEGVRHLDEAIRLLTACSRDLEHMRALAVRGRVLAQLGRRDEGLADLREALDMAHRAGAVALADRVHREIVDLGGRPRRRALRGTDSLTPAERQVALLAAKGDSNQQISQTLFLTIGTVERHLSRAYRKLDIVGRRELPDALAATIE